MAKDVKKTNDDVAEDSAERRKQYEGLSWDDKRKEDERRDRERLRQEHQDLTPEKIDELRTELSKLKMKFESDVRELREKFIEEKADLEQQIGAGGGNRPVSLGAVPTNETLADGSPRRWINIPVTA
jgi:hypothetical protein